MTFVFVLLRVFVFLNVRIASQGVPLKYRVAGSIPESKRTKAQSYSVMFIKSLTLDTVILGVADNNKKTIRTTFKFYNSTM